METEKSVPYTPLQPGHQGEWFNPDRVGEGFSLSIIETKGGDREIFVNFYLLTDDGPFWAAAGGNWHTSWVDYNRQYILTVYQRQAPGQEAQRIGQLVITPQGEQLHVLYVDDVGSGTGNRREGTFHQLSRPNPTPIGPCKGVQFSPPAPGPQAPAGWCHQP